MEKEHVASSGRESDTSGKFRIKFEAKFCAGLKSESQLEIFFCTSWLWENTKSALNHFVALVPWNKYSLSHSGCAANHKFSLCIAVKRNHITDKNSFFCSPLYPPLKLMSITTFSKLSRCFKTSDLLGVGAGVCNCLTQAGLWQERLVTGQIIPVLQQETE